MIGDIPRLALALGYGAIFVALGLGYYVSPHNTHFPNELTERTHRCPEWRRQPRPLLDAFAASHFSEHLTAAGENSLYRASMDPALRETRTVRLTWLRSFHAPIVVRVDALPDGRTVLTAKRLSGAGGYSPGAVEQRLVRSLTAPEREQVAGLLAQASAFEAPIVDCVMTPDGSRWILEASGPQGYQFRTRWSPQDGPIMESGLQLLRLTGWDIEPVY